VPTTSEAVLKLFPIDGAGKDIDHHVADANTLVSELLGTSDLTAERLEMIARYLAAHFYVLSEHEGGIFEEQIGESREKRGSTFTLGQGLKLTRYGQMVLSLDTTGTFDDEMTVNADGKKEALFRLV
jgi:hypothetical protein